MFLASPGFEPGTMIKVNAIVITLYRWVMKQMKQKYIIIFEDKIKNNILIYFHKKKLKNSYIFSSFKPDDVYLITILLMLERDLNIFFFIFFLAK